MSIFPVPTVAHRDRATLGPMEPLGRGAAPLRNLALAAGLLLSLVGPWPVAAEAQTTRVGSAGETFLSGASARGAPTATVGDAVPGPRGTATRAPVEEGTELTFILTHNVALSFSVEWTYTVVETGDMVVDGDDGTKTVTMPAGGLELELPPVRTVDDDVHEPDSTVRVTSLEGNLDHMPGFHVQIANVIRTVRDNDAPTVSIGDAASVVEGGTLSFPVTLDHASYRNVMLDYELAGTAGADDYAPSGGGTLTIPAGETRVYLELRTIVDGFTEGDEDVVVTIANVRPAGGAILGKSTATGTIADNDDPPAVTVADATAPEDADLVFEVTLSPASSWEVSVEYEFAPGTATENADYGGALSGSVTFAPGQTSREVVLDLEDDVVDEDDETVTLTLSGVRGATLTNGAATGTIVDNDDPPVLGIADAAGPEGTRLVFAATLSAPSSRNIEFGYEVTPGTATAHDDYAVEGDGTAMIPAGETEVEIPVSAVDDDLYEPDETFEVAISEPLPAGGATIGRAVATGTITDGDGLPTVTVADATGPEGASLAFEVTLSPASSREVSLRYEVTEGTATENDDYRGALSGPLTFAPGETSKEVALELVDDAVAEEDETVTLALSDVQGGTLADGVATGTITDDDGPPAVAVGDATAPEDASLVFAVTLSPASSGEVTVQYAITPGTAQAADYAGPTSGTVTFSPGETAEEVVLDLVDDEIAEEDETVTLTLSGVQGGTLAGSVATGTITDNDGAPTVRVSDATAAEGERLAFAVTLRPASSGEVTVRYAITPGTATDNADYAGPTSGAVTFAPGQTAKEVVLDVVDDEIAEEDETVTLALSGVRGATLADGVATGTIIDDDGTPAVTVADATAAEGDGSLVFAVTLRPASSREVAVEYEFAPGTATENADYRGPISGAVTFAPGETAREIALELVDDEIAEQDETVALALSGVRGATLADGVATGMIADDDGAPAVRVADATAAEGEGRLAFAVTLSRASSQAVTVEYEFAPGTATENADYAGPTSGAVTFGPGETAKEIALELVDDEIAEEDETVTLALSDVRGGTLADGVATGTITDDDDTPAVAVGDATATEGEGSLVFAVTLSPASSREVAVDYEFAPGTATENADYAGPASGSVTFAPGETAKEIALELVDDEVDEEDETVTLALSALRGAAILAEAAATGTIRDDDLPRVTVAAEADEVAEGGDAAFVLTRAGATTEALTVAFAVTGGDSVLASPPPTEAAFEAGAASARVMLATEDDGADEADATVTLTLAEGAAYEPGEPSQAAVVVRDDDEPPAVSVVDAAAVPEGGALSFLVSLSRPVDAPVTVDYALAGTATAGEDYDGPAAGSVTFAPGETEKTIVVATVDDERDEPDETVAVTLAAGDAHDLGASRAAGVILDDDEPPEISVCDSAAVPEGSTLTFPVLLSRPVDAAVTVDYVLGGTATAGEDYEGPAAGSVTFAPGETEKTILVATVDDERDEPDETVEVTLSVGAGHDLGASRTAGVILDDDEPPSVTVSAAAGRVAEGEAAVFVLKRTGDASEALTVELAVSERGGDMVPAGSEGSRRATFEAGATTATLAVATGSDGVAGPDSEVTAALAGGDGYAVGRPDSATVAVSDGGGESLLAEGRRLGAASLLRRHVQRFSQLTSVAALAALEGVRPPSTANLRADGDGLAASGDFGVDLPSGWDGWGSVRYSKLTEAADGGVRDFYAGGSRVGADGRSAYGALVGFESAPVTSRGVRLDATHTHLGLYGARRFGEALTLDGALGWGRGDHDLSLVGGPYPVEATHRSTRLVARGGLTGDFGWGTAGLRIEPQLGLLYAEEDLDAFTDSLGGAAPGERLWLARLGFGPRLTWRRGDGATRARLRVNFDAHNLGPSGEDREEMSAEFEVGHRRRLGARGSLDVSAGVDGLGSDWFSSTSFGLTYEGAF